ncbi:hypothetical protein [Methyloraptor flagellatus]|uniref:Universal stress protein n=1 Tax=Methyloraptor flagellatus TaxID=3162530 RepID=A0AAU7XG05_9HYPH
MTGTTSTEAKRPGSDEVRTVTALLTEPESVVTCLECAKAAASPLKAVLRAAHVGFDPATAAVSAEELDIQFLRDREEGSADLRADRIRRTFEAWVASAGVPVSWEDDPGDIARNVAEEATESDLLVIGRPLHLDGRDALHAALFRSQKLVLLAPPPRPGRRPFGRHMVIGWKPGEHAIRAIEATLPWLRRAETISVLSIAKAGGDSYGPSAKDLLARFGLSAAVWVLERNDQQTVGNQLLRKCAEIGADSLVIGAYHHGAFWESILGGVTRDVIAGASIPVFLKR